MDRVSNINIENAKIIFRNFSGRGSKFNPEGKRNFCVIIDDDNLIEKLKADGWNIKMTKPRDPDQDPTAYIQVSVKFENFPPKIYMITSNNKVLLDEDSVSSLDWAEIKNADLIIRPYEWEVNGKGGVKAFLKTMYVTIEEDIFEKKYVAPEIDDDDMPF